jgi:hypothetical protein
MGEWRYNSIILYLGTSWRGQLHASAAIHPRKKTPSIHWSAGSAPEPVWTLWSREKISCTCRESNPVRPARSYTDWPIFRLFTLCSARVSALVIVLSESPCERNGIWETCPILKEGRSLVRDTWSNCDKNWQIITCIESEFRRLCRHTRIMGRQHQRRCTMGENQHRQRSLYTEVCFEKSQYCSTGDRTAELNIHL